MAEKTTVKDLQSGQIGRSINPQTKEFEFVLRKHDGSEEVFGSLTEARNAKNFDLTSKFVGEVLSRLPPALGKALQVGGRELIAGGANVLQGIRGTARAVGEMAPAIITPGMSTAEAEALIAAGKIGGEQARIGMGVLQMASAVPQAGGQLGEEATTQALTAVGVPENVARGIGRAVNVATQFGMRTPGTRLLPAIGGKLQAARTSLRPGKLDPLETAVRESIESLYLRGGRLTPRRQAFQLESALGERVKSLNENLRATAGRQMDTIINDIPSNTFVDAQQTRLALRDLLEGSFIPRGGRVKAAAEREALELQEIVGGFGDARLTQIQNDFGISKRTLSNMANKRDVNAQTLDQIRKDLVQAYGRARPPQRKFIVGVINGVKNDISKFSQDFPDEIAKYFEGIETFKTRIFPIENVLPVNSITGTVDASRVVSSLKNLSVDELTGLKRAIADESIMQDYGTWLFSQTMDSSFLKTGAFDAGLFAGSFSKNQKTIKALSVILSPDELDSFMAMAGVIEEAGNQASKMSRIGQLARPFAIFTVARNVLKMFTPGGPPVQFQAITAAIPAFVLPGILQQAGKVEAASKILTAAGRVARPITIPPKLELARQLFSAIEVTRRSIEDSMKKGEEVAGPNIFERAGGKEVR